MYNANILQFTQGLAEFEREAHKSTPFNKK